MGYVVGLKIVNIQTTGKVVLVHFIIGTICKMIHRIKNMNMMNQYHLARPEKHFTKALLKTNSRIVISEVVTRFSVIVSSGFL